MYNLFFTIQNFGEFRVEDDQFLTINQKNAAQRGWAAVHRMGNDGHQST